MQEKLSLWNAGKHEPKNVMVFPTEAAVPVAGSL